MSEVDFTAQPVRRAGVRDPGLTAVFYGIDPIPGQLDNTVKIITETDDVVVYNFDRGVIYDAEPKRLPKLIDDVYADFLERSEGYNRLRTVGVSLGVLIGYNLQNKFEEIRPAVYACAGVNLAKNLTHHPMYFPVKRKLHDKGFDESDLAREWRGYDLDEANLPVPGTQIVGLLTRLDQYVPYPWVMRNMKMWHERTDVDLDITKTWKFGHTATINAFDSSFRELLERADEMQKQT